MNTAQHHDTTPAENAVELDDLRVEIDRTLDDLLAYARLIRDLTTTHQTGLGFLTPAGREQLDAQLVADRRHRRTQPDRLDPDGNPVPGLDWLNRDTVVAGSGHVRAPGTTAAISMGAQIWFTLSDLIRRTIRRLERSGICILRPLGMDPDTGDVIEHLRHLLATTTVASFLRPVLHDLEQLSEEADIAVHGDAKAYLDNCPHCSRPTLLVYFRDDLIRCDRDPKSGHYEPCKCRDEFCDCQRKPVSHRHTWYRSPHVAPSLTHTWSALNNLIKIRAAVADDASPKEPTS